MINKIKIFFLAYMFFLFIPSSFAIEQNNIGIGVELIKDKNKIFITQVYPNTPAYKAGILEGSEIIQIDDIKVRKLTIEEIFKLTQGEINKNTKLLIKKNRQKLEYNLTQQNYKIASLGLDKNFFIHWKQVVPTQYEKAVFITPYRQYSNNLLRSIHKNNYWVERRNIFKTGYDACLSYPTKDRNACYMNLVNREIDRTLKEKQIQNQQELIRQQMYQNMQLQNMYYRHPCYWY